MMRGILVIIANSVEVIVITVGAEIVTALVAAAGNVKQNEKEGFSLVGKFDK